jgi:hypothetical protein
MWIGAAAVVLVGGAALVFLDVIPLGGMFGGSESNPPLVSQPAPVEQEDSLATPTGQDSAAALPGDSLQAAPPESAAQAGDTAAQAAQAPTQAPAESVAAVVPISIPQISPVTPPPVTTPPVTAASTAEGGRLPSGVIINSAVVAVDGLAIQSVVEFPSGGSRVVHLLESGDSLTVRALPVPGDPPDSAISQIRVIPMPGDSAVGTARFRTYNVNVRGRLSTQELQALLRQLVEIPPDDRE